MPLHNEWQGREETIFYTHPEPGQNSDYKKVRAMMPFSRLLRLSMAMSILSSPVLLLSGCANDKQSEQAFTPLNYSYLSRLNLNVSRIDILDQTTENPVEGNIAASSPVPPAQALRQMVQDRLAAVGTNGDVAQFIISRASILNNAGGNLAGQMNTRLTILNPEGLTVASSDMQVTRQMRPNLSDGNADKPANLYALTKEMMQDMNVELEYQLQHKMTSWMLDGGGKPLNSAVQTQSLDQPGSTPAATTDSSVTPAAAVTVPQQSASSAATVSTTTGASAIPSATSSDNAPVTITGYSAAQPSATKTPSQSAEPDAVFPAGEDTSSDSTATQSKVMSPPPHTLKLPG